MSALRDHTGESSLRRLSRVDEMEFVAGGHRRASGEDAWLKFLRSNPEVARELGALVEKVSADLRLAYPGETRETTFTNADWAEAGYEKVVEMNELMGLKGL